MITRVSSKGQTVIPAAIREKAKIQTGDELEVGCSNGLVVMRKRKALTAARVRKLLVAGYDLPNLDEVGEQAVEEAKQIARKNRPE